MSRDEIERILQRDGQTIVTAASRLAGALQSLKAAQLRNFYGSLLKIEARANALSPAEVATEFHLLRPKLQYMANREGKARPLQTDFDAILKTAAERMGQAPSIEDAVKVARGVFDFAEAVVAYHKEGRVR